MDPRNLGDGYYGPGAELAVIRALAAMIAERGQYFQQQFNNSLHSIASTENEVQALPNIGQALAEMGVLVMSQKSRRSLEIWNAPAMKSTRKSWTQTSFEAYTYACPNCGGKVASQVWDGQINSPVGHVGQCKKRFSV